MRRVQRVCSPGSLTHWAPHEEEADSLAWLDTCPLVFTRIYSPESVGCIQEQRVTSKELLSDRWARCLLRGTLLCPLPWKPQVVAISLHPGLPMCVGREGKLHMNPAVSGKNMTFPALKWADPQRETFGWQVLLGHMQTQAICGRTLSSTRGRPSSLTAREALDGTECHIFLTQ